MGLGLTQMVLLDVSWPAKMKVLILVICVSYTLLVVVLICILINGHFLKSLVEVLPLPLR